MELTDEQVDKIVFLVTEKILLRMPEVIGNLMTNHAEKNKIRLAFLDQHPEFKTNLDVVRSVIEDVESNDLTKGMQDILTESVPEIKKRISMVDKMDFGLTDVPSKKSLTVINDNGVI